MDDNDVRVRVRVDDDTRRGMGESTGGIKGALEKLGPIAAGAGTAIAAGLAIATTAAALLKKALDASIERSNVGSLIAAQLGDTKHVAELGKLAGSVYADNFGESIQEAGQAVRDVIRMRLIPEDAADSAIKAITEKVMTVGTIAEAGSEEVSRAVHKMLVTGLAANADEALDLLTRGFQKGADEAGDLLDTFDEYSIQFKELGISGKEALGLISQGLKGGARDADTVADALKELAIRAQDGSAGSAAAFKQLGLDGKQLSQMFASGGTSARTALDMIIDKTKGITDPMQRNAIAVGLFGTKAEDLQDALFGLDLDTAAQGLGDIEGAADKASAALGSGLGPTIETFKRKAQQAFADVGDKIAPQLLEGISTLQEFAGKLSHVFDGSEVPSKIADSIRELATKWLPALREAFNSIAEKVRENKDGLETLGHVLADYVIPFLGGTALVALKLFAGGIGRVIETVGVLVVGAREGSAATKTAMINMALAVVNTLGSIIIAAAKAFSWVPGLGPKLDAAAKDVREFVDKVNNELKNIRDQDVYVRTHFVGGKGQSRGGEYRTGGIKGAATGGVRDGLTMVGEEGRELVRLPQGAMVYPRANTNQLMAQGGGGVQRIDLYITGDDSRAATYALDVLANATRIRGNGSVQLAVMGKKAPA